MAKSRKYSIEDLDSLINDIKSGFKLKEEEIAVQLGYNEGYISQTRARGFVPDKFMESLKREFAKSNPVRPQGAQHAPDYKDRYILLLEEKINLNEARVLQLLQRNHALLNAVVETLPKLVSKVEKIKLLEAHEEMNKRIEHHLDVLKKESI